MTRSQRSYLPTREVSPYRRRPLLVLRRIWPHVFQLAQEIQDGVNRDSWSLPSSASRLRRIPKQFGKLQVPSHCEVSSLRTSWICTSISRFSPSLVSLSVSLIGVFSTVAALVDSGATMNFINERIVATSNLETEPCTPTRVLLADGRTLAHSNRQVMLKFTIAGVTQTQTFFVAPIGVHSIILGMPWLEYPNPMIDWRLKTVQIGSNVPSSLSQSYA